MSRIVFVICSFTAFLGVLNAAVLIYDLAVLTSTHLVTAIVAALFALTAAIVGGVGLELSRALTASTASPLVGMISRQATGTPMFG